MSRRRLTIIVGAVLVVAWGAYVAIGLNAARRDARVGQRIVEQIRDDVDDPTTLLDDESIDGRLRAAADRFARAGDRVGHALFAPVKVVPVLGRQVRAVDALAGAAESAMALATDVLGDVRDLVDEPPRRPADRVRLFRQLGDLASRAGADLGALDLGPSDGLVGALADARTELATEIDELRTASDHAADLARAVAHVLEGDTRYLVFAANNAEMRAGSGMFLLVGELEAGGGSVRLGPLESVADVTVPAGAVPLEGDLRARWGWLSPEQDWRNLMLSPRFDASAPLAVRMWEAAGHAAPDGVMVVDALGLEALVEATGPVRVDGREIAADQIAEELLHRQYVRFESDFRSERQDALGRIAEETFDALDGADWDVPDLAGGLARAARGRHLMLWSRHEVEQRGWASGSVDGSLEGESLLLAVQNRGGNKLDWFLDVDADLVVERAGDVTETAVRVRVGNDHPEGEPVAVRGPNPEFGLDAGRHRALVTLNVPGAARRLRVDGFESFAVAGDDGVSRVVGVQVEIAPGDAVELTIRFDLPAAVRSLRVEPSARVPPISWAFGDESWRDRRGRTLHW